MRGKDRLRRHEGWRGANGARASVHDRRDLILTGHAHHFGIQQFRQRREQMCGKRRRHHHEGADPLEQLQHRQGRHARPVAAFFERV